MTSHRSQQFFDSFINHEIHLDQTKNVSFKIERVRELFSALRLHDRPLKIVHVAGSKGKGSVCALTANMLQKAGYKTGLYTSPHLNNYRERIRILDGCTVHLHPEDLFAGMITEQDLCEMIDVIKPAVEGIQKVQKFGPLTFFEVFTAIALNYFKRQKCDVVILETGIGGRLDATNAVDSLVAAITPISLEHTHLLGSDIAQIAREKAGIIKSSEQSVVLAPQEAKARDAIKKRCYQFSVSPLWADDHIQTDLIHQDKNAQTFDLTTVRARYRLSMPLLGIHQRNNCALAVGIIESLREHGLCVPRVAIEEGANSVHWPGRFEIVSGRPTIILDGAHNKASVLALISTVRELYHNKKIVLVLGISRDKDVTQIIECFAGIIDHVLYVKSVHPRAINLPGALRVEKALKLVERTCTGNDVVVVTGSLFVVAEARKFLLEKGIIENRGSKMEGRV